MFATEIIVALIGGTVTLITPFIALGIRKYCDNQNNNQNNNQKNNNQNNNQKDNNKKNNKPKSMCEIYSTPLPNLFGTADTRFCNTKKSICPHCKKTFCENHISVNFETNYGGHICKEYEP